MQALDRFPYTGHAVIVGRREYPCQNVDEVLGMFGRQMREARAGYREFVAAGFRQGMREELRGGGLVRSAGGWANLLRRKREEWELGDERVLGGGEFVREVLDRKGETPRRPARDVEEILAEVRREHGVGEELVLDERAARRWCWPGMSFCCGHTRRRGRAMPRWGGCARCRTRRSARRSSGLGVAEGGSPCDEIFVIDQRTGPGPRASPRQVAGIASALMMSKPARSRRRKAARLAVAIGAAASGRGPGRIMPSSRMLKNPVRGVFQHRPLAGAAPSRPFKSLGFSALVIWHPIHGVHRRPLFQRPARTSPVG